jgi:hypothetical protein
MPLNLLVLATCVHMHRPSQHCSSPFQRRTSVSTPVQFAVRNALALPILPWGLTHDSVGTPQVIIGFMAAVMPGSKLGKGLLLSALSSTEAGQELEGGRLCMGAPAYALTKHDFGQVPPPFCPSAWTCLTLLHCVDCTPAVHPWITYPE